jgi:hypothetical protein
MDESGGEHKLPGATTIVEEQSADQPEQNIYPEMQTDIEAHTLDSQDRHLNENMLQTSIPKGDAQAFQDVLAQIQDMQNYSNISEAQTTTESLPNKINKRGLGNVFKDILRMITKLFLGRRY